MDLHCHGGGGVSFADGEAAARTALETHRRHGTTTSLASLVTDTEDALVAQVRALDVLVAGDELAGVHLEGPWLSPLHPGAHRADLLTVPTPAAASRLVGPSVRVVTLAPELPGGLEVVARLREQGVVAALGHSDATWDQARSALDAGTTLATHLHNAARPVHHREPGPVLALLEDPRAVVELVADGVHLHPATLRSSAARAAGGFALVTDAMAAAGAGDGTYRLGSVEVRVEDGVARTADTGAVAGSTLTLDRALRHAVHAAGVPLVDAVIALTRTPATVLGREDVGVLRPGSRADLVCLDGDLRVLGVLRRGRWVGGTVGSVRPPHPARPSPGRTAP